MDISTRRVLTQKPVFIIKNSMEAPTKAETTEIFKYQSRNFIFTAQKENKLVLKLGIGTTPPEFYSEIDKM